MNTKLLLSASAIVMGTAGIAASFLPLEIPRALAIEPAGLLPVLVQLLGAALFAFAMINWTARGSLIGGIYNRPVALGNLTHFVVGGMALTKAALSTGGVAWGLAAVYLLFAAGFTMLFFRSPVARGE